MPNTIYVGYKPLNDPTSFLASANRQYSGRSDPGEYNNTIVPFYQVKAGDILLAVHFYCLAATEGTSGSVSIGPYITNNTGSTEGARATAGGVITTSSAVAAYRSVVVNQSLAGVVGQWIKPGGGSGANLRRGYVTCASGDSVSVDSNLPTPFGNGTARTNLMAMYLEIQPAQQILSVEEPTIGSASAISTMGFDPAINHGSIDSVPLVAASNNSITLSGFIDGQVCPRAGANRSLSLSNGGVTVNTTTNIKTPIINAGTETRWTAVETEADFNTGEENSIAFMFDPPLAEHDIFYHDATKGTIGKKADYDGTFVGSQLIWHHQASTKIVRSFELITGEQGEFVSIRRFFGAVYMAADYFQAKQLKASGF